MVGEKSLSGRRSAEQMRVDPCLKGRGSFGCRYWRRRSFGGHNGPNGNSTTESVNEVAVLYIPNNKQTYM